LIIGFSLVLALYMAAQETTDSRSIAYPEHQNKQGWILTFFRWSVRETRDLDDSSSRLTVAIDPVCRWEWAPV